MKLFGLTLKNYIGIYNGMGLNEISIDFSKCRNSITIIKGDNGSGKSTLFKAMTPMSDTSDNFIPDMEAQKVISYLMDDGSIVTIEYNYYPKKPSRCHITKNGVELNPTGNMSEGKEIISDIFDFDSNFITLSQLSSEDRGLADKKPSERKKFINRIISSMEVYNNMYKTLSKKSSAMKMNINSLAEKIKSIGDKPNIINRINSLENSMGEVEDRRNLLLAQIGACKSTLESIDGDDIIQKMREIKHKLSKFGYTESDDGSDSTLEKDIEKLKTLLIRYQSRKEYAEETLNSLGISIAEVQKKIEDKRINLSSYGDTDLLESLKSQIETTKSSIMELSNSISGLDSVDMNEYKKAYDIHCYLLDSAEENHNFQFDLMEDISPSTIDNEKKRRDDIVKQLPKINSQIGELKATIKNFHSGCVPDNCNLKDSCPLACEANKYTDISEKLATYLDMVDSLETELSMLNSSIEYRTNAEKMRIAYDNNLRLVRSHYKIFSFLLKSQGLSNGPLGIANYVHNPDILSFSKYNDISNIIRKLNVEKKDLSILEEKYMEMSKNESAISLIKSDLANLESKLDELNESREKIEYEIQQLDSNIKDASLSLKQKQNRFDCLSILSEYKSLSDGYEKSKKIIIEMERMKKELDDIVSNKYPMFSEEIEKLKYKLVLLNEYNDEYKEYSRNYSIIETIKKYTSPTTGIQTVFMGMYMNDIISTSNNLLQLLFNGEYVLHPFIINENEFRIPCSGNGITNDDISSMSTSQICMISMIISFALLNKSSSIYNIIKLDEMDGGLDSVNRSKFIILLQRMMDMLNCQQCIMISHNSELNMTNADIILLKNSDPTLEIDGNIIFKL